MTLLPASNIALKRQGSMASTTFLSGVFAMQGQLNNHVEGWNNRLAGKSYPNIYKLVDLFKPEQAATEVTLRKLEEYLHQQGRRTELKRKDWRPSSRSLPMTRTRSLEEYVIALS